VGDCVPFGCSDASVYQEVFDSSLFSGPITIAGLTFFLNNFDNADPITGEPIVPDVIYPADYTILFSIVQTPVDDLDPDVENNIDPSTAQTFFIGALNSSVSGSFTIQTSPANYFVYDPSQGNLLMQILNDGTDLSLTVFLDINSSSGGLFSSAFDSDPHPSGCPDGSAGVTTGCTEDDYGLVVGFDQPSDFGASTPEPAAAWMALSGVLFIGLCLVYRSRRQGRSVRAYSRFPACRG
jgi:hypothetical protein